MSEVESAGLQRLDLDDPETGLLAYSVAGKITAEQAQEVFGHIEAAAAEGRKLRLYCVLDGFPTAEPSVFVEKFKHMGSILKTIERMAIIGDSRWLAIYTKVFDPITKPELRHFKTDERDLAAAWIRE